MPIKFFQIKARSDKIISHSNLQHIIVEEHVGCSILVSLAGRKLSARTLAHRSAADAGLMSKLQIYRLFYNRIS